MAEIQRLPESPQEVLKYMKQQRSIKDSVLFDFQLLLEGGTTDMGTLYEIDSFISRYGSVKLLLSRFAER